MFLFIVTSLGPDKKGSAFDTALLWPSSSCIPPHGTEEPTGQRAHVHLLPRRALGTQDPSNPAQMSPELTVQGRAIPVLVSGTGTETMDVWPG